MGLSSFRRGISTRAVLSPQHRPAPSDPNRKPDKSASLPGAAVSLNAADASLPTTTLYDYSTLKQYVTLLFFPGMVIDVE
jgi:hypothetical protein